MNPLRALRHLRVKGDRRLLRRLKRELQRAIIKEGASKRKRDLSLRTSRSPLLRRALRPGASAPYCSGATLTGAS